MTPHAEIVPSVWSTASSGAWLARKMPRAIEILDATVRRIERGEMNALEAIDALLAEELTLRENRRVKMALVMARLSAIKTLAGFDFSFQPSLDRNRIMALAELQFIDRAEALHLIGPPGTVIVEAIFCFAPSHSPRDVRSLSSSGIDPDRPDFLCLRRERSRLCKIRSRAAHCARASALAVDMGLPLHPTGDPRRDL